MLDIKFIKENAPLVKENLKKRGKAEAIPWIDELITNYAKWLHLKKEGEDLRHQRNIISEEINKLQKEKKEFSYKIKEIKEIPEKIKIIEKQLDELTEKNHYYLLRIPNILHKSVPLGNDATKNKVLRKWGKIPRFSFPLKNHVELAESLQVADFEAGRKVAGQGFNYLLGKLALLDLALQRYGIDFLIKKGFTVVVPPLMLNKSTLGGAVDLTAFEDVIYKVENEDLYLVGTAEHALVSMMKDTVLKEEELPLKVCAVTPCFRKEIGAHGVDTKGLFRMHQFNKVEQVVFTTPEDSFKMLEQMQKITADFFKSLKIPFRVIEICAGDLGGKFAKQYDIEAYFPRQKEYREVTSAGNCTDYQARRLNIRYEVKEERKYAHILNNTMVATSRAMVAILENYQLKDGSIKIPTVLQKYTGFKKIEKV